jgi:hypothetical protein
MVDVVRGEGSAKGKKVPASLVVGSDCYANVKALCEQKLQDLEEWKEVITALDLPAQA